MFEDTDFQRFTETAPEPQALKDYAERVGAERRNFRRYVIREVARDRYHIDRYVISIEAEGEVKVREAHGGEVPDEIKPTDEERAKIKEAWDDGAIPRPVGVKTIDTLIPFV